MGMTIIALLLTLMTISTSYAASSRTLATGLSFPEGPALSPDGRYLYCVNVQSADITRIDLQTGEFKKDWVVLPGKGRGNGSTIGLDGALYVTDVGAKTIDRIDCGTGAVTVWLDHDDSGSPLKGPNDLCFDSHGNLYFTDPEGSSKDKPIGCAYVVLASDHSVHKIAGGMQYPNGIVQTGNGAEVYVNQTPPNNILLFKREAGFGSPGPVVYDEAPDGGITFDGKPGPDGMRFGPHGHLYVAIFGSGVIVECVSKHGKWSVQKTYEVGTGVTNLCFAADHKSLYVTETASNTVVQMPL
jgi:gluconolactonase